MIPTSFKTDPDKNVPIWTPNCLAAVLTGSHLSTGATLIAHGSFISRLTTTYHGQKSGLPSYHRDMRYSRYSRKDQSVLNALINKAVDWLNTEAREIQLQHRAIPQAQSRAMAAYKMESNAQNIRVPCLKKEDKDQVGLAFQGKNLAVKRKCPFCNTLFSYSVAIPGSLPWTEINWNLLPEIDENRPRTLRGCCAEALTFIQGIPHREQGFFRRLQNELGLSSHPS